MWRVGVVLVLAWGVARGVVAGSREPPLGSQHDPRMVRWSSPLSDLVHVVSTVSHTVQHSLLRSTPYPERDERMEEGRPPVSRLQKPVFFEEDRPLCSEDSKTVVRAEYICNGTVVDEATYHLHQNESDMDCYVNKTHEVMCLCPMDYYREGCFTPRPFECVTQLSFPTPSCRVESSGTIDSFDMKADGDPRCFAYRQEETIAVGVFLNCTFTDREEIQESIDALDSFDYWVRKPDLSFALSHVPDACYRFRFKPFNFNELFTDNSASREICLTGEHFEGQRLLTHSLSRSSIPDEMFQGKRIYMEAGVSPDDAPPGLDRNSPARLFFDFVDDEETFGPPPYEFPVIVTVLLILLAVAAAAILALWFMHHRDKAKRRLAKSD